MSAKKKVTINDIPHTAEPNQVTMAADPTGAIRTPAQLEATPLRSRAAVDEQFPTAALGHTSPEDALMTEKLQLSTGPGITPFGKLVATDSDFKWLQEKQKAEAEANFQQWFALNFDRMGPEQKAMARKLFPTFYQQRLELIDKEMNLMKKLAKLKVTGIEDKDDLILQYGMERGYIDTDRMENLLHPEKAASVQRANTQKQLYARGLLNSNRLQMGDYGIRKTRANAEDALGRNAATLGGNNAAYNMGFQGGTGFSSTGFQPSYIQAKFPALYAQTAANM